MYTLIVGSVCVYAEQQYACLTLTMSLTLTIYVLYTIGWNFWGTESHPSKILHETLEKSITCSLQLYQISQSYTYLEKINPLKISMHLCSMNYIINWTLTEHELNMDSDVFNKHFFTTGTLTWHEVHPLYEHIMLYMSTESCTNT